MSRHGRFLFRRPLMMVAAIAAGFLVLPAGEALGQFRPVVPERPGPILPGPVYPGPIGGGVGVDPLPLGPTTLPTFNDPIAGPQIQGGQGENTFQETHAPSPSEVIVSTLEELRVQDIYNLPIVEKMQRATTP